MSLRKHDLKYLVYDIFEVDSYKSKLGEDNDVVVLAFGIKDKSPADDLVNFIENGYPFVLDADVTPGELADGNYKVFVEIERNQHVSDNIFEMLDGIKKITGINDWKFRYYKNFKHKEATLENLNMTIPKSSSDYQIVTNESTNESYKDFFKDSYVETVSMLGENLILNKPYAEPVKLKFIDFGNKEEVLNRINESFNPWEFAEIIYLSKYIGDYNITKYGNKLTLENKGKTLVVERIS